MSSPSSSSTGGRAPPRASQVHVGDVLWAYDMMKKDKEHANYLVATMSPDFRRIVIHNAGGDSDKINAHDACLKMCEKLFAAKIPCWGVYSYKVIENDKPGEKAHSIKMNGFLLYPSDVAGDVMEALKNIKQRAKNTMFKDCDVFAEMHTVEDLNSDAYWKMVHDKSGGRSSKIFIGGHDEAKTAPKDNDCHAHSIIEKAAEMEQRRSKIEAHAAGEEERERRISEHTEAEEENNQQRRASQLQANALMHQEQVERVKAQSLTKVQMEAAGRRLSRMKSELFSTENVEKREEIERKANRQAADAATDEVQREILAEQHAVEKNMDDHQAREREKAIALQDEEQERRNEDGHHEEFQKAQLARKMSATIHEDLINAVDEMERKHSRVSANADARKSQMEKIEEHGLDGKMHTTFKQRRSKESIHEELKAATPLRMG